MTKGFEARPGGTRGLAAEFRRIRSDIDRLRQKIVSLPINPDTDWQPLALESGFTGTAEWRCVGKTVEIRFDISGSISSDTAVTSAMPSGYRPTLLTPIPLYANPGPTSGQGVAYIAGPGQIRAAAGSSTLTRIRGSVRYFID